MWGPALQTLLDLFYRVDQGLCVRSSPCQSALMMLINWFLALSLLCSFLLLHLVTPMTREGGALLAWPWRPTSGQPRPFPSTALCGPSASTCGSWLVLGILGGDVIVRLASLLTCGLRGW